MQVLLQQVALVIVDERRGATHHGALDGRRTKQPFRTCESEILFT